MEQDAQGCCDVTDPPQLCPCDHLDLPLTGHVCLRLGLYLQHSGTHADGAVSVTEGNQKAWQTARRLFMLPHVACHFHPHFIGQSGYLSQIIKEV